MSFEKREETEYLQNPENVFAVALKAVDVLERKLMSGNRKGVTQTMVTWFVAHPEHHLSKAE